jgi:hypothetical protein
MAHYTKPRGMPPSAEVRHLPPHRLCSRCGREPRLRNQRWGSHCFRAYRQARRHATNSIPPPPAVTPKRWDPALIEQLKRPVVEIAKYPTRPEVIRVSVLRRGVHDYVDLRVYRKGHATRQGLVIHVDLLPQVLAGLQQAGAVAWEALPRPAAGARPPWREEETAVHWPAMD